MAIFNDGRKVIDVNPAPFARLIVIGIVAFFLIILLFNSVTTVQTGNVGVLTLFGDVTGPTLGSGIHLVNPLEGWRLPSARRASGLAGDLVA